MSTEITARDKVILYVVGLFAFVFFFVRFLFMPGLSDHEQAAADLAEAQQAQMTMQDYIVTAGSNAAAKNEAWGALQAANATYYSTLSSSELDTLVTGLELSHNMTPTSLSIGAPAAQTLTGYTASALAGQSVAPAETAADITADTTDTDSTAAQTNTLLTELTPAFSVAYDLPSYFTSANVTFSCTGDQTDFQLLLDDLAANYPSVQLQNITIQQNAYVNSAGSTDGANNYTVQLAVLLCDKGGIQP